MLADTLSRVSINIQVRSYFLPRDNSPSPHGIEPRNIPARSGEHRFSRKISFTLLPKITTRMLRPSSTLAFASRVHIMEAKPASPRRPDRELRILPYWGYDDRALMQGPRHPVSESERGHNCCAGGIFLCGLVPTHAWTLLAIWGRVPQ